MKTQLEFLTQQFNATIDELSKMNDQTFELKQEISYRDEKINSLTIKAENYSLLSNERAKEIEKIETDKNKCSEIIKERDIKVQEQEAKIHKLEQSLAQNAE